MKASKSQFPNRRNLNNLPDEILHHILTFLPVQDGAATSLISRRWLSLWSHLPLLHFPYDVGDDPQPHASNTRRLVGLVDRILLLRSSTLTSFRLSFIFYPCYASHIDSWLRCVIARLRAREIHLSLFLFHGYEDSEPDAADVVGLKDMYEFPFSFLRGSNVERLSLLHMNVALPSKTSAGFDSIKKVVVDEVGMPDEAWDRMVRLCPMLEEMDIRNAGYGGSLVICNASIKKLRLKRTLDHDETSLVIDCPNLVSLCFDHVYFTVFRMKNVSSVVEFDFCDMYDRETGYDKWCRIVKLLPLMPALKRLSMHNWCFKVVSCTRESTVS